VAVKVAINGLGRIGRCILRYWAESGRDDVEIVAVNASGPIERLIHLIKYDSTHGVFKGDITGNSDSITINGKKIARFEQRDPAELNWSNSGVDTVLECTGVFTKRADAAAHLKAGAKKVIISAPSDDADAMIVYGVNNEILKPEHEIISIGSCTTNCLAPMAKALNDSVGIESGFMTTVHSYTNDQNILDASHKDLRRARAGALSIIPTSTGAAKAIGKILPELEGKLDGVAVRVPTPNVSLVDLVFTAKKKTSAEEINKEMEKVAKGSMKGVVLVCNEPLVSVDFNGSTYSSVFDATQTYVVNGSLCRVASWYDNEWAFSARMIDIAALMG